MKGEINMSIDLYLVNSLITDKKNKRQLIKQIMEEYDDRYNKLRL